MPADIEACVKAVGDQADNAYALCNWMKSQGKGYFAHGESFDVAGAVREFKEGAGPLVEPTFVIGHEEDQPLLDNTGIPAAGYVVGLRRRGDRLYADLSQVFPSIARLIEAGAYKHVSAEIYPRDNPPEGVHAEGPMLRRVAAMGGMLPHLKSLADLPAPKRHGDNIVIPDVEIFQAGHWQGETYTEADLDAIVANFNRFSRPATRFADRTRLAPVRVNLTRTRRVWQNDSRTWACFSEVRKMADSALHDAAVSAVKAIHPDLPDAFLADLTDEQLAMLAAPPAETGNGNGDGGEGAAAMQDTPDRATMINDLVALGEDPAALEAMADADLQALWMQKKGMQMAETTPATTATSGLDNREQRLPSKVTTTEQFSEQRVTQLVESALARLVAPLRQEIKASREDLARERATRRTKEQEERHGTIKTFCERMVKEGRLRPADVEAGKDGKPIGPVLKALHAADGVRKFSDGKTALQLQMDALEALPARRFGEQVPDPLKQQGGGMDSQRREHLLSLTSKGRAVLAKEEGQKQNARVFAEALGGVLKSHLNGNGN